MNLDLPAAVFFDLDGTLVDTAPDLGHAANHVRLSLGLEPLPLSDYRPVASAGARGLLGKAIGITPEHSDFPRHRDAFLDHYAAHLADYSRPFAGIAELLDTLRARGIRWGVMTNKPARYTNALMRALQLDASSAVTISADEVPAAKPAPDGLLECCRRLQVAPERCWYVGDDHRDIVAGRAANMRTVAAGWGYEGPHPIASWAADYLCATPDELAALFQ